MRQGQERVARGSAAVATASSSKSLRTEFHLVLPPPIQMPVKPGGSPESGGMGWPLGIWNQRGLERLRVKREDSKREDAASGQRENTCGREIPVFDEGLGVMEVPGRSEGM